MLNLMPHFKGRAIFPDVCQLFKGSHPKLHFPSCACEWPPDIDLQLHYFSLRHSPKAMSDVIIFHLLVLFTADFTDILAFFIFTL